MITLTSDTLVPEVVNSTASLSKGDIFRLKRHLFGRIKSGSWKPTGELGVARLAAEDPGWRDVIYPYIALTS